MRLKKLRHPAVIGQSIVDNRVYIDSDQYNEALQTLFLNKRIVLSKRFRFFPYTKEKSEVGYCSAPYGNYTAHHCVCSLCSGNCKGKTVELFDDEKTTAEVITCNEPKPLWSRLMCAILAAFGYTDVKRCSQLDWCLLSKSNPLDGRKLLGVLSAGPADGSFAIFSPFSVDVERDRELVGTQTESISYDFYENKVVQWKGVIDDVIVANVSDENCLVQIYGYVVKPLDKVTIKPGYSGSPLFLATI
ncbi:MAG: hypothetical protein JZD41_01820 [Thermoproteus sp.]|nr:hypothetical protein [Thermoproteus sp.]